MRKSAILGAVIALLLLVVPAGPVAATPPSDVMFEVPTAIPPEGGPSSGPFTATGPAVDAGLLCSSGDTVDVFGKAAGFPSDRGINLQVVKLFTCDDLSGDFLVKLQVRIDKKGDNFNWTILGGTGAYEDLHGTGKGVGLPICGDDCVLDIYEGRIHID